MMFMDYATNAACPERPSWQVAEVGYKWAKAVLHNREENTDRFELKKACSPDITEPSCCVVIGCCLCGSAKAG